MIQVKDVTKQYGSKRILKGISFQLGRGEIVGLLGRNGAGKSTLLNILTGYIPGNSGTVLIDQIDIEKEPQKAKRNIGYLPEQPPLYDTMTVAEYLVFVGKIKKIPTVDIQKEVDSVCEKIGLVAEKDRLIKNLSKGYRQRVGIAQAMLGNPGILILDEPTSGLDPKQIMEIRAAIKAFGENRTVLVSSHIISEVTEICDRILILNNGELAADRKVTGNGAKGTELRIHIRVTADADSFVAVLKNMEGIHAFERLEDVEEGATDWKIIVEKGCDIRGALFEKIVQGGWKLLVSEPKEDLEALFISITEDKY